MRGRVFGDKNKLPTIFKQQAGWHQDHERTRLALLDHLDDTYYAGLITRAKIRTPGEILGPPPSHVLVVCGRCGVGAVESKVTEGWTEQLECPQCHAWISPETHLPQTAITREEMLKHAVVDT